MSDENIESVEVKEAPQEVTTEAAEAPETQENAGPDQQMSTEDALNLLVGIARNSRLTYQEHRTVDNAIEVLIKALNN
jgi:hypothetical protein